MSRYCLDTVAYSHFKRGDERIVSLLESAEWVGVPVIVLGELLAGFELGSRRSINVAELEAFLAEPAVEIVPVDRTVAEIFSRIFVDLRRRGRPVPTNDIWIAAACARAGATLLTWDTHFREMPMIGATILE